MLYWFDRNSILKKEAGKHKKKADKNAAILRHHVDNDIPMEPDKLKEIYWEMRARYDCAKRILKLIAI